MPVKGSRATIVTPRGVLVPCLAGLLIALGTLAPAAATAGPVLFDAPFLALGTPDGPAAFVLADMNGDGTTDIVAYTGSSLVFIQGHGDGTFGSFHTISFGRYSETLAVGDFNEDGFPDIAAISVSLFIDDEPYPMAVDVFLGDGAGSFALLGRTPYPDEGWPSSIAVADMDQDGHLDLVTTRSSPEIDILPGNGDGTFGAIRPVPSSGSAHQATVADLDRNGIPDMVVTRNSLRSFLVYLGTGGGAFTTPMELPAGFGPIGVAVGDLNGDSNPDIAVANGGWFCAGAPPAITRDSTVTVYLGDGTGNFASAPSVLTGDDPWSVSLADMDSDGILDLVVGHDRWRGGICWAGAPPMGDSPPSRKTAAAPSAASSIAEPGLSVFKGRGDGTFDPAPIDTWSDLGFLSSPADLNRDGRQDIVAVYSYHASLAAVLTREDGSRAGGSKLHTQAIPQRVLVHDMDHDGRADVIVNSYEAGTVELFEGKADRHLPSGVTSTAGQHPVFLAPGDLDEDGIQDLVVADFGVVDSSTLAIMEDGGVLALRGSASGTFAPFGTAAVIGNIVTVRIGDMNGDGHMDIVGGSFAPPTIFVLLGHGDGTFTTAFTHSYEGRTLQAAAIGDFNGDGLLDVAIAPSLGNTSILYGVGDGTLLEPVEISVGFDPVLEAADLSTDGRTDVVGCYYYAMHTYLARADATFLGQTFVDIPEARAIDLPDVNGDAVPDLVMAGFYQGVASVFIGTGGGLFTGRVDYGAGYFPTGIDVGDIDGDGRQDMAVANAGDNTIDIMWGTLSSAVSSEARSFLSDGVVAVSAASSGPPTILRLEPVGGSFRNEDVVLTSLSLHAHGTGSREMIRAGLEGIGPACCDQNQNGVMELVVPFAAGNVALLFDRVHGTQMIPVELTGVLKSGQSFRASLALTVMGAAPALQARLVHQPSRGSTLYVTTATFGRLSVHLYDVRGRMVRTILDEPFASAGMHTARLDGPGGESLASGVYFYRAESNGGKASGRVVILH